MAHENSLCSITMLTEHQCGYIISQRRWGKCLALAWSCFQWNAKVIFLWMCHASWDCSEGGRRFSHPSGEKKWKVRNVLLITAVWIYFNWVTSMKYCNEISVDAVSLSKVSLLPEAEVKVKSHCLVLCLNFKKGDWVKVIQVINGIACQTFYLASNLKELLLYF